MPAGFPWRSLLFCDEPRHQQPAEQKLCSREVWIDWIRAVRSVGIVALHVVTREKVRRVGEVDGFDGGHLPLTKQ